MSAAEPATFSAEELLLVLLPCVLLAVRPKSNACTSSQITTPGGDFDDLFNIAGFGLESDTASNGDAAELLL